MDFLSLDAQDYETALKEARTAYGSSVRVHTRKDYLVKKGMRSQRRCTITFYLVEDKPHPVQDRQDGREEETLLEGKEQQQQLLTDLLQENDFSDEYVGQALQSLLQERQFKTLKELEMALLEHILENVRFNHSHYILPKQFFVLLGPAGVGKTTTLVKMAMFYLKTDSAHKVALLSLDSYRTGATDQIEQFSKDFGLDLFHAHTEQELSELLPILDTYSLVLVDTMGKSANQGELALHLKSLLMVLPQDRCSHALAVSASHKGRDLERFVKLFSSFPLESLVVTKLDETEDIGNVLSVSKSSTLPLLFFTNGQKVPENLMKATGEVILSYLRGFSFDLLALGQNQNQNKNDR